MRQYSQYYNDDPEIKRNLEVLTDKTSSSHDYGSAFYILGEKLSEIINIEISDDDSIMVACSTEDADWLTKGIIEHLKTKDLYLAVFWNLRKYVNNRPELTIAPIIKSYIEQTNKCDTLVVCKSIIYTSCVVRTNLTYLINDIEPKKIIIAAPVIFEGAESSLKSDFNKTISDKFEFVYFAIDDTANSKGEVIPGIGGSIYERLGLQNSETKNKFIPQLVRSRRE